MGPIVIESDDLRLVLNGNLGGGVARLDLRDSHGAWCPLWRPSPQHPSHFNDLAMYLLAPWSNRIQGPSVPFGDRRVDLRPDWPDGTAIHGCVKDRPFRLLDRSPVSARLVFDSREHEDLNWPMPFRVTIRYEVDGPALHIESVLTHAPSGATPPSRSRMPAGLGFHPFFMRTLWAEDQVHARVPVTARYPAERMLPTGSAAEDATVRALRHGVPVADLALDDCFLGSLDGAEITYPASRVRLTLNATPTCTHTVLYTGGEPAPETPLAFFCLEPVTMLNNGFNLRDRGWDDGVVDLAPGESLQAGFSLRIERF